MLAGVLDQAKQELGHPAVQVQENEVIGLGDHAADQPAQGAAEGDGLQPAVVRLMSVLFGSGRLLAQHAAEMLQAAEYDSVHLLPAVPGVPIRMIVGRRPLGTGEFSAAVEMAPKYPHQRKTLD